MIRDQLVIILNLAIFVFSLVAGCQQNLNSVRRIKQIAKLPVVETTTESPSKKIQALEIGNISPKTTPLVAHLLPKITFDKTVCDLGEVGQSTKNTCEFKFTNIGQGLLKIGNIKRTCGCTVFNLDKKEYASGEAGVIKVSYIAGRSTTHDPLGIMPNARQPNRFKLKTKETCCIAV